LIILIKAFGKSRLDAENATTLFDLGMGTGKIAIQAFLQFKNLIYVYGVELSYGRYKLVKTKTINFYIIYAYTIMYFILELLKKQF
jgi:precorrin-6B methylase 2